MSDVAAIVLAAGKSTRMKSELPKVLHEICGRPMLSYVLSACRLAGVDRLLAVVGHGRDLVEKRFSDDPEIVWVEQREQKGTGHAVQCCREALAGFNGSVLVIAGDMPLLRRETLAALCEAREQSGDALSLATTELVNPRGYGRIVRETDGSLLAIVEEVDCTPEQRGLTEVNPSYYCFDAASLFEALDEVTPSGAKGEFYLTDAVKILKGWGRGVSATVRVPAEDATGINSREDLAAVGRIMQDRLQQSLLRDGVTIVDPDNTWIEADVSIGRDSVVYPFSYLSAGSMLGERCRVGPFVHVTADRAWPDDSVLGPMVREAKP